MPDIALWNKCNNKCLMCTNSADFYKIKTFLYTYKKQIEKLEKYLNGEIKVYWKNSKKKNYISITGGEPTIHPDFLKIIYYIRKRLPKIKINLLSNGRRFANENFTKKFSKIFFYPSSVAIPIHHSIPKYHDEITGINNSFDETIVGVKKLIKYFSGDIEIRIVVHKMNIKFLGEIIDLVKSLFKNSNKSYQISIIHYEIEGVAETNKNIIKLKLKDAIKEICKLKLDFGKEKIFLYHYPLCLLPKHYRKFALKTLPKDEVVYTSKCKKCKLKIKCVGLMKRYYELYGDKELKTIDI